MSSIWNFIVANTAGSSLRLVAFGSLMVGATYVVGSIFSSATAPNASPQDRQAHLQRLSYDTQRFAVGQQQRLSSMIRDMADGRGDQHWTAAMRGTLLPHPSAENKTQAADAERLAAKLHSR